MAPGPGATEWGTAPVPWAHGVIQAFQSTGSSRNLANAHTSAPRQRRLAVAPPLGTTPAWPCLGALSPSELPVTHPRVRALHVASRASFSHMKRWPSGMLPGPSEEAALAGAGAPRRGGGGPCGAASNDRKDRDLRINLERMTVD